MSVTVVVGAQWGDEGKGKVTDFMAEEADVVARFQGGNNAGHTVIARGETFKFHLLPSGVVHPDVLNVLGNGLVIDPEVLLKELADLEGRGLSTKNVIVSDQAHVILPTHRLFDTSAEARAAPGRAIGTTGRGIGPCYADKISRIGVRMADLVRPDRLRALLEAQWDEKRVILEYRGHKIPDMEEVLAQYSAFGERLAPRLTDTVALLHKRWDAGENIVLEGAQGAYLDIDHGTFPFVTSSNTTAGGACTGTGLPPLAIDAVFGVVKAYTTRVGAGPFPAELATEPEGVHLTEKGHEFGTTTGRRRRCGWLDLVLLERSVKLNGITHIALTKVDVLAGLKTLKICVAYDVNGTEIREPPTNPEDFKNAVPVYEELPGFDPLTNGQVAEACAKGVGSLPKAARDYIECVEEVLQVPITLVGLGPSREATLRMEK